MNEWTKWFSGLGSDTGGKVLGGLVLMSVLLCCENNSERFEGESGSEYRQIFIEGLETFKG